MEHITMTQTVTERTDTNRQFLGYGLKKGEPGESSKEFRRQQKEREIDVTKRICREAGPIPYCHCKTCETYRKTKTCGPEHEMTGCICDTCEDKRYQKRLVNYGLKHAKKNKKRQNKGRRYRRSKV